MNDFTIYNKAVRRIIKRESLKVGKTDKAISYEEAKRNYSNKLKEVAEKIKNGELDDEIKKEMEVIRQELKQEREER